MKHRTAVLSLILLFPQDVRPTYRRPTPRRLIHRRHRKRLRCVKAGVVSGRVTWVGQIPSTPPFLYGAPRADGLGFEFRTAENPNRPLIDAKTRAVRDAVVFLRGIDPRRAGRGDLPPVRVRDRQRTNRYRARRTARPGGFVCRGDEISVSSTEPTHHVLRGRGDAFFSLALPEPNHAVIACSENRAASKYRAHGLYWPVPTCSCRHPYFTVPMPDGRFIFDRVPAGESMLSCGFPGWYGATNATRTARRWFEKSTPCHRVHQN